MSVDHEQFLKFRMKRTESNPKLKNERRKRNRKGGGGVVTNSARWRSKSDSGPSLLSSSINATQSLPNLTNDRADIVQQVNHTRQSLMFMEQNSNIDGDNANDNELHQSHRPPRRSSIKSFSYPQDPPPIRISRKPSVTFLPFALRPLPLLKRVPESSGQGLRIKGTTSSSTPSRRKKFMDVFSSNSPSGGSQYMNVWINNQDNPGSTNLLLARANHFGADLKQRRKRVSHKFCGGFKRKQNSTAYYMSKSPSYCKNIIKEGELYVYTEK